MLYFYKILKSAKLNSKYFIFYVWYQKWKSKVVDSANFDASKNLRFCTFVEYIIINI
jgi:hypothetical protein